MGDFRARGLPFGGARPSLFEVNCNFPGIIHTQGLSGQQGGRFVCSATQLPAWVVDQVRVPYFVRIVKYKGDRTFQDWNVTVLNDEDFMLRDAFESWSNFMNYMQSNIMDPAFIGNAYKQDLFVKQYAKDGPPGTGDLGRVIREYQIIGAWPSQISPINLSWAAQNEIETFDVTWAYDWFEVTDYGSTSSMENF